MSSRGGAASRAAAAPKGFPVVGIALGLVVGIVVAILGAWAYAYIDLYFPVWSVLITLGFGAVLGYAPSLMMVGGGVRGRKIGFPLVVLIACFGYWLTWAVWVHAVLARIGEPPSVSSLLADPSQLSELVGFIRQVGVWKFIGGDPIHGGLLLLVWIAEAALILGMAFSAGWKTLSDDLPG
jgi:hypothetical protein